MNTVKTPEEITSMRVGGKKLGVILKELLSMSTIGVNLLDVEKHAVKRIKEEGGVPSFTTVEGYPFVTCLCINEEVVHGIPTDREFIKDDLVSVDLAVMYKGWHTDCAWTKLIGKDREKEKFLQIGEQALWEATGQAVAGNRIGDIGFAIENFVRKYRYGIVEVLSGHGVGKKVHEDPYIPNYGKKGTGELFRVGMVVAIEPMFNLGVSSVVLLGDGYTYKTADNKKSAHFEHTIVITDGEPEILTKW